MRLAVRDESAFHEFYAKALELDHSEGTLTAAAMPSTAGSWTQEQKRDGRR